MLSCCLLAASAAMVNAADSAPPTYPDLLSALRDSGLNLDQPVLLEPVAYDANERVATYRLSSDHQKTRFRNVHTLVDPTAEPVEEPITDAERALGIQITKELEAGASFGNLNGIVIGNSASGRCDLNLYDGINLASEIFRTNLDFNNLGSVSSSVNDRASSLRTFCSPVMVYQHKQWTGSSLFVPANTTINNLASSGMNNLISSHFIICD